jgi:uncharacterized membrane protein YqjE
MTEPQTTTHSDQPVGELVKQLSQQTSELARKEVELAKAELAIKGRKAGIGAGMFGGAGLFGVFAFAVLTAAAILALAIVLDAWLAALIIGAAYAAIAGVLALTGKQRVEEATPPAPERTIENVKEDVQWTKQRAQEARR